MATLLVAMVTHEGPERGVADALERLDGSPSLARRADADAHPRRLGRSRPARIATIGPRRLDKRHRPRLIAAGRHSTGQDPRCVKAEQDARSRARAGNGARDRGGGDRRLQAGRARRREGRRRRRGRSDARRLQRARLRRHRRDRRGRARRGADALYRREGRHGQGTGPKIDIALDPLEGTTITAKAGPNALAVLAIAEEGCLLNAPDVYMDKIAIGPGYPDGLVGLDESPTENVSALAKAKGVEPQRDHRLRARPPAPRQADRRAARHRLRRHADPRRRRRRA